jgi:hypothetical protein
VDMNLRRVLSYGVSGLALTATVLSAAVSAVLAGAAQDEMGCNPGTLLGLFLFLLPFWLLIGLSVKAAGFRFAPFLAIGLLAFLLVTLLALPDATSCLRIRDPIT